MVSHCFRASVLWVLLVAVPALRGAVPESRVRVLPGHPRLFVPRERLAKIQERSRGRLGRLCLEKVRRDSSAPYDEKRIRYTVANANLLLPRALSLLVCYRLEGRAEYRTKALALADGIIAAGSAEGRRDSRMRLQTLAITYDWLHDSLSSQERARLRQATVAIYQRESNVLSRQDEFVSGHSHFSTASIIIAALALCDGSGEFEAELEKALAHWEGFLAVARYVEQDGGHHMGWRYGRSYAARNAWVAEAVTTASGKDLFAAEKPWLSQLGYHLIYGVRPDFTYFRVGDTHREIDANLREDVLLLGILASRYRDSSYSGFAGSVLERCLANPALARDAEYVYPLLFLDASTSTSGTERLPLVRAFPQVGNYTMRTGWGPDDTAVLFRAMPWYHFNHERRDFGSFLIYCQGGLAIHGGAYQADDESDYGGSHLKNYAWRTVAHNTITVHNPGEKFCAPVGRGAAECEGENRWANDGGQKIRSPWNDDLPVPHYQPRNVEDVKDPRFEQGRVDAYADLPELTYILADGTKAYRGDKVKLFRRAFFFLKTVPGWRRPVVVILDRVIAADASFKKTWNLHVVEIPKVDGKLCVIQNRKRIRFSGDIQPKPNDFWYQYSGKLYSETLLPRDARVEFVGGEGKEFWVDGRNVPSEIREIDCIMEPGIGRIEVSPGIPRQEDLFLHVLSPTEAGDERPRPAARTLETDGLAALRIGNFVIAAAKPPGEQPTLGYSAEDLEGSAIHVITGLAPSCEHEIRRDGVALPPAKTSPAGLLLFRASGGAKFELRPR